MRKRIIKKGYKRNRGNKYTGDKRPCTICGKWLTWDNFYQFKDGNTGKMRHQSRCKKCKYDIEKDYKRRTRVMEPGVPIGRKIHSNSVFFKVMTLPAGHPLRERYYRNRREAYRKDMTYDIWHRNGGQSPPGSTWANPLNDQV